MSPLVSLSLSCPEPAQLVYAASAPNLGTHLEAFKTRMLVPLQSMGKHEHFTKVSQSFENLEVPASFYHQ